MTTASSVAYRVTMLPNRHELDVTMTIEGAAADGTIRLETPTWTPGDYDFETFGRDVFAVKATDARTGARLAVRRKGWQAYQVEGGTGAVEVTFTSYCTSTDFSEECGVLDDRYGVLLGTRYLHTPAHPGLCRVTYELPEGWGIHHPSGARQVDARTWEYPSHEILVDTPVSMGAFQIYTRNVRGTDFHSVFLDSGVGFESRGAAFVDCVAQVAEVYHEMFGSFPFEDYTFVLALNPPFEWGLEHLTSTMVGLGPDVFTDQDAFGTGVRACAHELFHAWNVRRLRPAPLDKIDFYHGDFTDGLWVAEGFTRYYEFLTLTRTGIYSAEQFFSSVVNYYSHLAAVPAYDRVSAVDSSLAAYLNHSKYPGRVNNAIDYYDAGMVIAFDLDVALRTEAPDSSLDVAFAEFYRKYVGRGPGYTGAEIRAFFDGVHAGLGEWVIQEAEAVGSRAIVGRLEQIGFSVQETSVPYLGLVMQDDTGPGIYGVLDTSPAGQSGIAPEDVVTGVNGYPYSLATLRWVIANVSAATLDVLRGNQRRTYTIPVGERTAITGLTWIGSAEQAAMIAAWLRSDFGLEHGQEVPLDFYENFHGVETVI